MSFLGDRIGGDGSVLTASGKRPCFPPRGVYPFPMIVEDQGEVEAFLSRPEAFGMEAGTAVERVQTHISSIFLCNDRVLKLKRAVKFPVLDFSTSELRKRFCEAEVTINRRTAPGLYRGVLPVTREVGGALALDGAGEAVDWVVDMVRFDEEAVLDRMAQRGELDRHLMSDLAESIARFHKGAEVILDGGGKAGLNRHIESNVHTFAECPAGTFDPGKLARLTEETQVWLDRVGPSLEARRRLGKVRRCHGDLHLRNIVLLDGVPTLFDAIEFWDAIAEIDTAFDLAFLIMDLDHRDMCRHASILMNAYLDLTADGSALEALPLFLSVRAAIRAHVSATTAGTIVDRAAADKLSSEARGYLDKALAYLDPPKPRLVAVGGLSGSGKSHMGRELAPYLGAVPGARVVRTDVIRKRLAGVHPLTKLSQEAYSPEMSAQTYRVFCEGALNILRAGHSVIADAVFSKPEEREAIARVAEEADVPFTGLWLEAPPEVMEDRVNKRQGNASDADVRVVRMQLDYDLGDIVWHRVDSSGPREDTLRKGRDLVGLS